MRLADYTDYTLRVLLYCAARPQQRVTIGELAEAYGVSKNHLMKIVNDLGRQGVLETTRGRGGGLRLLQDPSQINIGDVVRAAETDFRLVECFDAKTDTCSLTPVCRLKFLFANALKAWFDELDKASLADIALPHESTPGRSRVDSSPSGGPTRSGRSGGAVKSVAAAPSVAMPLSRKSAACAAGVTAVGRRARGDSTR